MDSNTATLLAVVIGAVLATAGGFVATRLEGFFIRQERERSAALLFGEILSVLELIVTLANEARSRGEPYGQFTMRVLRSARRETEAYDRNRELLYDLRDPRVRAQIHTLLVRMTLALEGVFDATETIATQEGFVLAADELGRPDALQRLDGLLETRARAFDFAVDVASEIEPILALLRPLAKQTFKDYASVVRGA